MEYRETISRSNEELLPRVIGASERNQPTLSAPFPPSSFLCPPPLLSHATTRFWARALRRSYQCF